LVRQKSFRPILLRQGGSLKSDWREILSNIYFFLGFSSSFSAAYVFAESPRSLDGKYFVSYGWKLFLFRVEERSMATKGRPKNSSGGQAAPLSQEEVKRLIKVARASPNGLRNAALISVCLSGARVSEPLCVRVGDVVSNTGSIYESFVLPAGNSKSRQARRIYLSKQARLLLAELVAELGPCSPETLLFPLKANYATRLVNGLMREAGINSSSHGLRRSAATELQKAGISVPHIQQALGHKNLFSTQFYLDRSPVNVANAIKVLPW
jgi:integrase